MTPPIVDAQGVGADAAVLEAAEAAEVAGEEPLVDRRVAAGDAEVAAER